MSRTGSEASTEICTRATCLRTQLVALCRYSLTPPSDMALLAVLVDIVSFQAMYNLLCNMKLTQFSFVLLSTRIDFISCQTGRFSTPCTRFLCSSRSSFILSRLAMCFPLLIDALTVMFQTAFLFRLTLLYICHAMTADPFH